MSEIYCLLFLYVYIYYILVTHQNLQKKIYTVLLNTVVLNMPSQKRLIASQLKPRKCKDIKWILIENLYSLFI
jgi:hypothetical protein